MFSIYLRERNIYYILFIFQPLFIMYVFIIENDRNVYC